MINSFLIISFLIIHFFSFGDVNVFDITGVHKHLIPSVSYIEKIIIGFETSLLFDVVFLDQLC